MDAREFGRRQSMKFYLFTFWRKMHIANGAFWNAISICSNWLSLLSFVGFSQKFTCNRCHRHQFIARNPISDPISLCAYIGFSVYFWKRDVFSANIFIIFLVLYFSFLSHFICGSLIRHISCTNFTFRKFRIFFFVQETPIKCNKNPECRLGTKKFFFPENDVLLSSHSVSL